MPYYIIPPPYNFIMNATHSHYRRREYINQPYELAIIED